MSRTESSRVLVIDDDDLVLAILRKMLEGEMSVDVSLSAREALGLLPENRYDAILCDMWMPGMTGKDFYNQVKKKFPEYQSRIIFLTGDIASEATWDFIEQGHLPYVLKPIHAPELRSKLREIVGERHRAEPKKAGEQRRHRRLAMKSNVRVRKKKWAAGGPEITRVTNASKDGVYFLTERQYSVGTDVLVSFPYSGPSDLEQEGCVARVDERTDGRRGVAIAVGDAAEAARAALALSPEDRQRQDILGLADMTGEAPRVSVVEQAPEVADLKLQLKREREEARRLTDQVADLKGAYERAAGERDRLAAEGSDSNSQVRELTSAREAMGGVIEELKQQVLDLQEKLAAAAEREQAAAAGGVRQEAAQVIDLLRELRQAREAPRRLEQELGELKAVHERVAQQRDHLVAEESDRNLQVRELTLAREAMSGVIGELKQQVQDLQEKLAAAGREQARPAVPPPSALQEAAQVTDLLRQLEQARETPRRLEQELAELKAVQERLTQQRDRLVAEESDRNLQVRELTSAREAMSGVIEESKQQVQDLQEKLAAAGREQASPVAPQVGSPEEATQVADLLRELEQGREAARRREQELAELNERLTQQRDRLVAEGSDHKLQLRELTSTRDTMTRLIGEFQENLQGLQKQIAALEAERDQAQKEIGEARQEAEKWHAESLRQQQAAASVTPGAPAQASSARGQEGDVARVREKLKGLQERIQEFQGSGIGPMTILKAYCDMLAMNKSLDEETRKTAAEVSQQASLLRRSFQKLTRKS